MKMYR